MSKKSAVFVALFLIMTFPCLSFEAAAIHSIAGGCAYFGGDQDDEAYSISVTDDLGFVIAGYTKSLGAGGADFWLVKYGPRTMIDTLNRTITYAGYYWNMTYGGPEDEVAESVIQTVDGGFALAGYKNSSANGLDVWLVKTDSAGTEEWNATYGGSEDEKAYFLIQTDDGGYLLAGSSTLGGQSKRTLAIKTDGFGRMEWIQTLAGQGSNEVIQIDNGYAFAVNYPNAFGLTTVNPAGFSQSDHVYPSSGDIVETESIIQADNGYVLAGWTQTNSSGEYGTMVVRTDSMGLPQWNRTYEKLGMYSIIETINGEYALTGDRASVMIIDSDGNLLLTKIHDGEEGNGGKYFTRSYSITETIENHFYMVGTSNASGPRRYQAILVNSVLASDDTPPAVTVLSPENGKTYASDTVPLTVYVNKTTLFLWYSLDGMNATVSGNTTLPTLADGPHNITVYARDTAYNIGSSEQVFFSSETIQFSIDRSLAANPPDEITDDDNSDDTNASDSPWQPVVVASVAVVVTLAVAAVFVVFKQKKA